MQKYCSNTSYPDKLKSDKDKANWLSRRAKRMKLTKPKGRDSPQRIAADEEKSRQKAYNLYFDIMTDFQDNPNEVSNVEYMKEEDFFQKPVIGETQSSSKNPRLRIIGKKAG